MCWIAPDPLMSARVKVCPGWITTDGEIFHPTPRSFASLLPVPSVAMPPLPFAPVKFSGEMDRDLALESRGRSPRPVTTPSKRPEDCAAAVPGAARAATITEAASRAARESVHIVLLLGGIGAQSIAAATLRALHRRDVRSDRPRPRSHQDLAGEGPQQCQVTEPQRGSDESEHAEVRGI